MIRGSWDKLVMTWFVPALTYLFTLVAEERKLIEPGLLTPLLLSCRNAFEKDTFYSSF
jgi:hypothetical protein